MDTTTNTPSMKNRGTLDPGPGQTLYNINQAAALLNVRPDTLRWYLRRQHHIKPQRIPGGRHGTILLTSDEVQVLWELIKLERGW